MNEDLLKHLAVPIEHRDPMGYVNRIECRACGASRVVALSLGGTWGPQGAENHAAWCIFFTFVLK